MVATRHGDRVGRRPDGDEEGSDREIQKRSGGPGERDRRRVDPVLKEAHKRGLDVEKLHGSHTPAWGNLRGRTAAHKKQSYFEGPEDEEDELADQPSDPDVADSSEQEEEEAAEDEEEEEESDEGAEEQPRYARRVRQTAQRYSPPRDAMPAAVKGEGGGGAGGSSAQRRRFQQDRDDDSESEEEEGGFDLNQDNDLFTLRYPARERRKVEFFNPVQYEGELGGSQQPTDSELQLARKRRARERGRGGGGGGEDLGEEEQQERRQYSFRDRALVTIKPPSQQQPPSSQGGALYPHGGNRLGGGGGGHDRKRPRHERRHGGGGRLPRSFSRGRIRDEDEVDNRDDEPPAAAAAGGHCRSGAASTHGGAGSGGAAPWDLVQSAAANLPLSHLGKEKAGNAEITPLQVDPSVTFDTVGGLDHYIKALKEMIFLPLVYPELFERFHIAPPRGVLFYGPPGTGKTLVARALAAHASRAGKKVSFFMRKGADILSKWVGEAERQLRLLFEEAQRQQPSIIFFDEIDGLAPVRSSKQDQIHNSIVSTLLALMDGLDARGQVVVIGATNRVDALDGALRRPGRFDRELVFPLPNLSARADILRIHTTKWADQPADAFLQELASLCVGYCGADLKALCTEASLASLRRHYPQIYDEDDKLLIDPGRVRVERRDFMSALQTITPASHRSAAANARPLPALVAPVLLDHLQRIVAQLQASFPAAAACLRSGFGGGRNPAAGFSGASNEGGGGGGAFSWASGATLGVQRPRLLLCGPEGTGQAHLGPAVLYALEGLPVHAIGLPSLLSDAGASAPEEALVHAVVEARRAAPAILFLPHLQLWWDTAPDSLKATLWMLLADLPPDLPLLLFATADVPASALEPAVQELFNVKYGGAYHLAAPAPEQRSEFFRGISQALALPPPPAEKATQEQEQQGAAAALPVLPRAPEAAAAEEAARKKAADLAARQRYEEDQAVLRALRMTLRDLTMQLLGSRRWELFADPEEDPDWWDKVSEPMDLATILTRVDARQYNTTQQYLADMATIVQCSREFWATDPRGVREISRACALEDEARAAVMRAVPAELAARLEEMEAQGGPAPPPASLLALTGGAAAAADGKTPGHLLIRRPAARPHSDDAVQRRASRRAGADPTDNRMLHTDPEAAARHIRALKKQQHEQLLLLQESRGAEGVFQQEEAEGADAQQQQHEVEQQGEAAEATAAVAAAAAAAAGAGLQMEQQQDQQQQLREVLMASTKENLPGGAAGGAAAAAAAATPMAGAEGAAAAASFKHARGTLTAVAQQHGSSRLRREGDAQQQQQAPAAKQQQQAEQQQPRPATSAEAAGAAQPQEQQPAAAGEQQQAPNEVAERYQPTAADHARADKLQAALVQQTEGLAVDSLESIHARLCRLAMDQRQALDRDDVAQAALAAVHAWHTAHQQA